ncbi:MAG: HAMP domain-containing sensor histidine kinase [Alphaproteobacteria bacterium]
MSEPRSPSVPIKPAEIKAMILAAARWDPRLRLAGLDREARIAAFANARLRLIQRNVRLSLPTVPAIALFTALLLRLWDKTPTLGLWGISYALVCTLAMLLTQTIDGDAADPRRAARNLTHCGLLLAVAILPWATLPLVYWNDASVQLRCLIILLECGAIPWAMTIAGPSARAFLIQSAPLVAGLLLPPLFEGGELYWGLLGLGIIYAAVMYGLAFQIAALLTTMFGAQEEKTDLLHEVARAKSESDAARLKAERTSQAKSTFLANMSHELRTPLNAVLGFSEVIKNELLGPIGTQTYKEYAGDIHDSGRHLLSLINGILDLSRIEAGRLDLSPIELHVPEVVGDASRYVAHAAKRGSVFLKTEIPADLPLIRADERALRQILLNLLSNAVKFTPQGGDVTLSACVGSSVFGAHGMTIAILDNGIGIKREDLPIVLEAFGQAQYEHGGHISPREQGTGLGLPIVRALLEAHGGAFELQSEPGRGTRAIAHFPPSCVVKPAMAPPREFAVA